MGDRIWNWIIAFTAGVAAATAVYFILPNNAQPAATQTPELSDPVRKDNNTVPPPQSPPPSTAQKPTYLSDIKPYFGADYKINDFMSIAGKTYVNGVKQLFWLNCSYRELGWNLDGQYTSISGYVGLDDQDNRNTPNTGAPVVVAFYGDERPLGRVELKSGSLAMPVDINVANVRHLKVIIGESCGAIVDLVEMRIQ